MRFSRIYSFVYDYIVEEAQKPLSKFKHYSRHPTSFVYDAIPMVLGWTILRTPKTYTSPYLYIASYILPEVVFTGIIYAFVERPATKVDLFKEVTLNIIRLIW